MEPASVALAEAALALARRFAQGATLWCWAPEHPHHAQHLAVEFVHPVVVGARALPAVAVSQLSELRAGVRDGDVVVSVAAAPPFRQHLLTVSIDAGARPLAARADHVIWLGDDTAALYDGRVARAYHVLWELTQVCLEHPGLLNPRPETADV